jgi:hypothetical protein
VNRGRGREDRPEVAAPRLSRDSGAAGNRSMPPGRAGTGAAVPAGTAWAAAALATALLLAVPEASATRERPPTAHTGGFGEPTCQTCHFDSDLNSGPGSLRLLGVPETYAPGTVYPLTVLLVEPGLRAAGFQLTARFEDGTQAGSLGPADPQQRRIDVTTDRQVQYAHHLYDGTFPVSPDSARWTVLWTAPAEGRTVSFHLAANAADDDSSPLGDFIYSTTAASRR